MKLAYVHVTTDVHQFATGVRQPPPLCPVKYCFFLGLRWIWPEGLPNARQRLTSSWSAENPQAIYSDISLTRPLQFNEGYTFQPVNNEYVVLGDDLGPGDDLVPGDDSVLGDDMALGDDVVLGDDEELNDARSDMD